MNRSTVISPTGGMVKKVLYLMTKSFRIKNNYSLYEAVRLKETHKANLTVFLIEPLEENPRNKRFFLDNTIDLPEMLLQHVDEVRRVMNFDAAIEGLGGFDTIVIDKAYLNRDRDFFDRIVAIANQTDLGLVEVDSNVFQPVSLVSQKEEYSAKTIRDKIWRLFLQPLVLMDSEIAHGERKAMDLLEDFIENRLIHYDQRNDPSTNNLSGLSPYLKFGFISPNVIYDEVMRSRLTNRDSFIEELVVRRDLAYNFVYYNRDHDKFSGMTYPWAYQTMEEHESDHRKYVYGLADYLSFSTHDRYFNAAMREMVILGRMHSYMRMYWAKKIIEWSPDYETAYNTAIYLNNRYFLDGTTPNGYAGVAWCFGKHDRAWTERPIFGKLRYMNDKGLERKFDIEGYLARIEKEIKEYEDNGIS